MLLWSEIRGLNRSGKLGNPKLFILINTFNEIFARLLSFVLYFYLDVALCAWSTQAFLKWGLIFKQPQQRELSLPNLGAASGKFWLRNRDKFLCPEVPRMRNFLVFFLVPIVQVYRIVVAALYIMSWSAWKNPGISEYWKQFVQAAQFRWRILLILNLWILGFSSLSRRVPRAPN